MSKAQSRSVIAVASRRQELNALCCDSPGAVVASIRSGWFARFGAHLGGHGDFNELQVVGGGDLLVR